MSSSTSIAPDGDPGAFDTLILGIGNVLWADEGFGVRAVEGLHARYQFPDDVRIMDGGTQGIFLLPWVRNANRLLIFDAIDFGLPPATLRVIRNDDVPCFMGAKKVSMHQAGFQEVLSTATLSGDLPGELVLVGVQPEKLDDYGGSLRDSIKAQIEPAINEACRILREWGIEPEARAETVSGEQLIGPNALDMNDYERGRPNVGGDTR